MSGVIITTRKFGFVRYHVIPPDNMKKIPPVIAGINFRFNERKNKKVKNAPSESDIARADEVTAARKPVITYKQV